MQKTNVTLSMQSKTDSHNHSHISITGVKSVNRQHCPSICCLLCSPQANNSLSYLVVDSTTVNTYGHQAFSTAGLKVWNSLCDITWFYQFRKTILFSLNSTQLKFIYKKTIDRGIKEIQARKNDTLK